jgi:hypothetical protein
MASEIEMQERHAGGGTEEGTERGADEDIRWDKGGGKVENAAAKLLAHDPYGDPITAMCLAGTEHLVIGSVRGRVSVWALASAVDVDVDGHYALLEPLLLVCESDEEAVTCMDYDTNSRMLVCVFGSRSSRTWPFELLVPAFHVLLLCVLHMCPHTAIYVSSYTAVARPRRVPHTYTHSVPSVSTHLTSSHCCKHSICVSSYCYICVLKLLYMRPHTAT